LVYGSGYLFFRYAIRQDHPVCWRKKKRRESKRSSRRNWTDICFERNPIMASEKERFPVLFRRHKGNTMLKKSGFAGDAIEIKNKAGYMTTNKQLNYRV
jgi:hypothetical protein